MLLAACILASCGGRAAGEATPRPPISPSAAARTSPAFPAAGRPGQLERAVAAIAEGAGAYVAIPRMRYVPMWNRPGGGEEADYVFDARSPNGGRAPMLIADVREEGNRAWLELYLPIRPNGSTGWVRVEDVRVRATRERIEVDLSRRILERYVDGELVDRLRIGVGTETYPTATGTFYVWVKVPFDPPHPAYGSLALGLSGFSPVLSEWPGEGRMAIHGTPWGTDRGRAVSHGCVRVWNLEMERLADVPLGTPVIIRP